MGMPGAVATNLPRVSLHDSLQFVYSSIFLVKAWFPHFNDFFFFNFFSGSLPVQKFLYRVHTWEYICWVWGKYAFKIISLESKYSFAISLLKKNQDFNLGDTASSHSSTAASYEVGASPRTPPPATCVVGQAVPACGTWHWHLRLEAACVEFTCAASWASREVPPDDHKGPCMTYKWIGL